MAKYAYKLLHYTAGAQLFRLSETKVTSVEWPCITEGPHFAVSYFLFIIRAMFH